MITICSVTLNEIDNYLPIFQESILTKTKLVSEVLIAKADAPPTFEETWQKNGIVFRKFGTQGLNFRLKQSEEHAIGLHTAIKKSANDVLMFCDPDIFFYKPVDEIYWNLMEKYKLNVIGISHSSAARFSFTYFPNVMNLMVRKADLPGEDFLKGQIYSELGPKLDGSWLIRMKLKDTMDKFPNPEGEYDTGAYLYYWSVLNNWKWVSFQTTDIHTYSLMYNRGNVKLGEKFNRDKILYHITSSTCPTGRQERFQTWQEEWIKAND